MTNIFCLLKGKRCCYALFTPELVYVNNDISLVIWIPRNLKLSTCSTTAPSVWMGVCSAFHLLVFHDQILCLADVEEEVFVIEIASSVDLLEWVQGV
jgi:hypothetical protein